MRLLSSLRLGNTTSVDGQAIYKNKAKASMRLLFLLRVGKNARIDDTLHQASSSSTLIGVKLGIQ